MSERRKIEVPGHMAMLKRDAEGHLIPYYIAVVDCVPDYTKADKRKLDGCVARGACWLCGEKLGRHKAFLLSPIATVNRTAVQPPCHRDCAEYAAQAMPRVLREGVTAVWVVANFRSYTSRDQLLFSVGHPESASWWKGGRPCSREDILNELARDLPALIQHIKTEAEAAAMTRVNIMLRESQHFMPVDPTSAMPTDEAVADAAPVAPAPPTAEQAVV